MAWSGRLKPIDGKNPLLQSLHAASCRIFQFKSQIHRKTGKMGGQFGDHQKELSNGVSQIRVFQRFRPVNASGAR